MAPDRRTVLQNLAASVVESCRAGLDLEAMRQEFLPRLRRAVPIDALWFATVDPATLLFTRAYREEIPEDAGPYFVQNEFLGDDVNKWVELARDRSGARRELTPRRRMRSGPAPSTRPPACGYRQPATPGRDTRSTTDARLDRDGATGLANPSSKTSLAVAGRAAAAVGLEPWFPAVT